MRNDEPRAGVRSAQVASGVRGYLYDASGQDREVEVEPGLVQALHERALLWIDVQGRTEEDVRRVSQLLALEAASVRDLLMPDGRRDKHIDNYGNYLQFAVLLIPEPVGAGPKAAAAKAESDETVPDTQRSSLDFVVGDNWLLTVHDDDVAFLRAFRSQDKAETVIGSLSAHALVASLLDWHLEAFFAEVSRIEGVLDRLEERILAEPNSERLLDRILAVRRHSSRLRSLLLTQRPVFYGLGRPDLMPEADAATAKLFNGLAARFDRAVDEVEHSRELVVGSFELFTSRSSQQTNDLVKALTFFTVIMGSAAAIAGLFGMNFDPPFFKTGSLGFFAVTAGLFVLGGSAWIIGRRRRWI